MAYATDGPESAGATPTPGPQGGGGGHPIGKWLPLAGLLGYISDVVARINVGVLRKLLFGFFAGALLLLGMAILSLLGIRHMGQQVDELTRLQRTIDSARDMYYLVTAQSHYRAMAVLTQDDSYNDQIQFAKETFIRNLEAVESANSPEKAEFFQNLRDTERRYSASSAQLLSLYEEGRMEEVLDLHLTVEHPISHELEAALVKLVVDSGDQMAIARASLERDRRLLTGAVWGFSGVSLVAAMLLGIVLSWSFTRPVRQMNNMLARIAGGDFTQRVDVPNRDEFGALSRNLNATSAQLSYLYGELRSLNEDLQKRVDEQIGELERASQLRRYLSPQLAESILGGNMDVNVTSRRRYLTIFFSDIRGFTALSERVEPEELIDLLNQYLTAMTEIVFKYGGTLDKYIGDAIMVFFGDPVPYDDHAERAVKMALEMQHKLVELQQEWFMRREGTLTIGMGVSTGYVTVGNIGSSARMDYTVLGNHVNLASRLADQAEAGQILISERTWAAVQGLVDATEIDEIRLEGVSRRIKIFEINEKEVA